MGNASETSDAFASTISKEHDIIMGSLYSIFRKSNLFFIDTFAEGAW